MDPGFHWAELESWPVHARGWKRGTQKDYSNFHQGTLTFYVNGGDCCTSLGDKISQIQNENLAMRKGVRVDKEKQGGETELRTGKGLEQKALATGVLWLLKRSQR